MVVVGKVSEIFQGVLVCFSQAGMSHRVKSLAYIERYHTVTLPRLSSGRDVIQGDRVTKSPVKVHLDAVPDSCEDPMEKSLERRADSDRPPIARVTLGSVFVN
jgi:hypothetical protein